MSRRRGAFSRSWQPQTHRGRASRRRRVRSNSAASIFSFGNTSLYSAEGNAGIRTCQAATEHQALSAGDALLNAPDLGGFEKLAEVVRVWPRLSDVLRAKILAIVRLKAGGDPNRSAEPVPPEPQGLRGGVSPSPQSCRRGARPPYSGVVRGKVTGGPVWVGGL